MNRRFVTAAFGAALIVSAAIPAVAMARSPQHVTRVPMGQVDIKLHAGMLAGKVENVMLELAASPVTVHQADAIAAGGSLTKAQRAALRSSLKATQDSLKSKIKAAGGKVLSQYQDAYNGIKVRVSLKQVTKLAALPGVKAVHAIQIVKPSNVHGVAYIGAPQAWQDYGYTGLGVKIGIIDTGIDYYHADFGGSGNPADYASADPTTLADGGFPTAKVAGGYDFAGDGYDVTGDNGSPTPSPDPDPLDCDSSRGGIGHGTHVAGTAAGEGVLSDGSTYSGPYNAATIAGHSWKVGPGVAPQATIYMYKVFGCQGATDLTVDAINRAVADGVDVISMSLGGALGTNDDPSSVAANNAVQAGVVVVAAAGNSGPNAYIHDSPGVATGVIAAAAIDALPQFPAADIALSSGHISGINMNAAGLPLSAKVDAITATPTTLKLGCAAADFLGFTPGRIAVVKRGTCPFVDKGQLAQAAGASGIVVVNSDTQPAGALPPFLGPTPSEFTIPMIGTAKGAQAALIAAEGTTATITSAGLIASPSYQTNATFTSGGPRDGDSALKPDVAAPGVSITSAFVASGTEGQGLSGTSMATPHTAGVAALVVQAHPNWSPTKVKAAIMNTADASDDAAGVLGYDPRLDGSGVVRARLAVDTVALATTGWAQASLSFGYDPRAGGLTDTQSIRLRNQSGAPITYALTSDFVGDSLGSTVSVWPSHVTVHAHSTRDVQVRIHLSSAAMAALPGADAFPTQSVMVIEGAVTATPTVGGTGRYPLRVPFLVAPRSLSDVTASNAGPFTIASGVATGALKLRDTGLHSGNADVYAWGYKDPNDHIAEADIRAVGVQSLPGAFGGLDDSDRLLGFAVNTYGQYSTAANNEVDVTIDTDRDGTPDFLVIAADSGALLTGSYNGQVLAFVVDLSSGDLIDLWPVVAPTNGSTMTIYSAASDFGLDIAPGPFDYAVDMISLEGYGSDSTSGNASFDPYDPAVSQGDYLSLAHGDHVLLPVTVDVAAFATTPSLGWMVVSNDDRNGGRQADLVGVDLSVHGHHHGWWGHAAQ